MADDIAGSPVSMVRWSRRSTYNLSDELKENGISACPSSVGNILKDNDFTLKANRKQIAETRHPERNWQFEIIAAARMHFEDAGQPIISVDSKKKELIGNFKNPGKTWRKNYDKVYDQCRFLNRLFCTRKRIAVVSPYAFLGTFGQGVWLQLSV